MKTLLALAFLALSTAAFADAPQTNQVKFTLEDAKIRAAKGLGLAWNDKNNPLRVHVGDDLLFTNADSTPHIIHTNGSPFPHGDRKHPIMPGQTVTIHIDSAYDSLRSGPLYDHNEGSGSGQDFWIVAQ
jgi:hypothetical protein